MGKSLVNYDKIFKKLESVNISQDGIQSVASYLMMYKRVADKIVEIWFSVFRKASETRQLILFYVANELLQTCRQKNALHFKPAWKKALLKSVEMLRDSGVSPKVERILTIWEERRVYDGAFVQELKKILLKQEYVTPVTKTKIMDPKKVVAEFSPEAGIEVLRKCSILEEDTQFKLKQLDQARLDFSNLEAVRKLKDRAHGHEFSQLFDESYTALEEYVKSLESELEQRRHLTQVLELAEVFYDNQYHDAAVVADAYLKFGHRVDGMRQRTKEFLENMPEENVPSVDVEDAPSPGNTPPHMRTDRVSSEEEDMDLSEEETKMVHRSRGKDDRHDVPEEDRYSPSAAPVPAEAILDARSDAAAAAAMKIVSGYRPPPTAAGPAQPKAAPRRDPRIHPLQLGIPPPPPPPPLPMHSGGQSLLPPSLLSAAMAVRPPPPPPPRPGTPVRDEPLDGASQPVDGSGDGDGAGGSTPTQDEPPDEPSTPNTAINFLSNFIQLNTNPTTGPPTVLQPTPPLSSMASLWASNNPPPPLPPPPPQPPQPGMRLVTPPQPPPPPPASEVSRDGWPRPFALPPPPPPFPGFGGPGLRQLPLLADPEAGVSDGGQEEAGRGGPSPEPEGPKLPGLGGTHDESAGLAKDMETGENEGYEMAGDNDQREDPLPRMGPVPGRAGPQLHRIQTIGTVPYMRAVPPSHSQQPQPPPPLQQQPSPQQQQQQFRGPMGQGMRGPPMGGARMGGRFGGPGSVRPSNFAARAPTGGFWAGPQPFRGHRPLGPRY